MAVSFTANFKPWTVKSGVMAILRSNRHSLLIHITGTEVTGALGDSITVLPLVTAVAVLTDLSLTWILIWFGVFQIVWGLYYGLPLSVEPMKALVGLLLVGAISAGELLVAGLIAGVVLLGIGLTNSISYAEAYLSDPVIRGVQLGVALLLIQTGVDLGLTAPVLTASAIGVALAVIAIGYWNITPLAVLLAGGVIVGYEHGFQLAQPALTSAFQVTLSDVSITALDAAVGQLAMTVGNAAVATSLLLDDYFGRTITPDELAAGMGVMNLLAIPLGGLPMCHGSGGVAGKYTFGARTAGANLILGGIYLAIGVAGIGLLLSYPHAILGVILVLIAMELGRTALDTKRYTLVLSVAIVGFLTNLGLGLLVGVLIDRVVIPGFRTER